MIFKMKFVYYSITIQLITIDNFQIIENKVRKNKSTTIILFYLLLFYYRYYYFPTKFNYLLSI